ncbi:WXG100 family type VII secretion target [Lentzea xinjiangensis]|uniref:WXG100 family type VII secretion target n=1 Tax=Lentzea xinjiangensis TaxID=402600 RepID=A0A1H9DCH9_9PSEU|nr:WXG100 family type VII secretion target [Lentzea xinjiangensis]
MVTSFEVDPTALRAASPKFSAAGDKLQTAFEALRAVLDANNGCWGGDEAGQEFAKTYVPLADKARQAFPALAEGIHSIREGLDASADTWEAADQAGAKSFGGK